MSPVCTAMLVQQQPCLASRCAADVGSPRPLHIRMCCSSMPRSSGSLQCPCVLCTHQQTSLCPPRRASTAIIMANKTVLSTFGFSFSTTLTFLHTVTTMGGMSLFAYCGLFTPKNVPTLQVRLSLPIMVPCLLLLSEWLMLCPRCQCPCTEHPYTVVLYVCCGSCNAAAPCCLQVFPLALAYVGYVILQTLRQGTQTAA